MSRLVLVGEAPGGKYSITARRSLSLTGASGRNLCRIAGWDWLTYLHHTTRLNLFYDPMPDGWPAADAARRADEMVAGLQGRRVILLGSRVARAFGADDAFNYWWWEHRGMTVARVPHPSGLNRKWNEASERDMARIFLGSIDLS